MRSGTQSPACSHVSNSTPLGPPPHPHPHPTFSHVVFSPRWGYVKWHHLRPFLRLSQLPLEPWKALCNTFTCEVVLPKACKQTLMCKVTSALKKINNNEYCKCESYQIISQPKLWEEVITVSEQVMQPDQRVNTQLQIFTLHFKGYTILHFY